MTTLIAIITAITLVQTGPVKPVEGKDIAEALSTLKAKPRADVSTMVRAVVTAGTKHNVDPIWLLAVAYTESRYKLTLVGDGGSSHGPFQMGKGAMRTAKRGAKVKELYSWGTSADIAARYWGRLFRKYGPKVAPVIYNCGPIRCKQADGKQRKSTPATRGYWRIYKAIRRALER